MRDEVLILLLVISLLLPAVIGLITTIITADSERKPVLVFVVGTLVWLIAVAVGIGVNLHVHAVHPGWWEKGGFWEHVAPMWLFDILAAFFAVVTFLWSLREVVNLDE